MFKNKGFSLIELMIVVGIVAVLGAMSLPAYQRYVLEGRRTDATRSILECAAAQERRFTLNNSYTYTGGAGAAANVCSALSRDRFFTIVVTDPGAATAAVCATAGNCYLITAAAAATRDGSANPQLADNPLCNNYTLDSRGVRAATGIEAATATRPNGRCWRS